MDKALGRFPDRIIGEENDPYLLRWHVIPRNKFFNIYLHKFCKSDEDRALHDHPWLFNFSILLKGTYLEHVFKKRRGIYARSSLPGSKKIMRKAFSFSGLKFRWGKAPHRVELLRSASLVDTFENPVWTVFITGPTVREWGFYCPQGWRHWKIFTNPTSGGNKTGRGCE